MEKFYKSVAASLLIALGVNVNLTVGGVAGAVCFAFGLLGVCVLNFNLFTGKCGYLIKKEIDLNDLVFILIINIIAGWGIGCLMSAGNADLIATATRKVSTWSFSTSFFIQSFMCGVIMWLAVDIYNKGNPLGILLGIPLFILCGFQHSIANVITLGMTGVLFDWSILLCILGNFLGSICICFLSNKK